MAKTAYQKKMGVCLRKEHGNMKKCARMLKSGKRMGSIRRRVRKTVRRLKFW